MKTLIASLALVASTSALAGPIGTFTVTGSADMWSPNANAEAEANMKDRAAEACGAGYIASQIGSTTFSLVPRAYPVAVGATAEFTCVPQTPASTDQSI